MAFYREAVKGMQLPSNRATHVNKGRRYPYASTTKAVRKLKVRGVLMAGKVEARFQGCVRGLPPGQAS
jgi:hypothetical protein